MLLEKEAMTMNEATDNIVNNKKENIAAPAAEDDRPAACMIAEKGRRGKPDLCCCYVIDASGRLESPCHKNFESLCC
jgi:hypothetical protein